MSDFKDDLIENVKKDIEEIITKNDQHIKKIVLNFIYNLLKPFHAFFLIIILMLISNFIMMIMVVWSLYFRS